MIFSYRHKKEMNIRKKTIFEPENENNNNKQLVVVAR